MPEHGEKNAQDREDEITGKKATSLARALDAAAELIAAGDAVDLSIADVVASSRCFTATIADADRNKDRSVTDPLGL